jgi:hypothetical protein
LAIFAPPIFFLKKFLIKNKKLWAVCEFWEKIVKLQKFEVLGGGWGALL